MTAKRAGSPFDLCKFEFSDGPGSFYFLFRGRLTAVGYRFLLTPIIPAHRRPPGWGDIPVPWSDQENPAEKETRKNAGGTSDSKNLGWAKLAERVNCRLLIACPELAERVSFCRYTPNCRK